MDFAILRKNQEVTVKSIASCGGNYHYGGSCKGGELALVKTLGEFIPPYRCYAVTVEFSDKTSYRLLENEIVEYDKVISTLPEKVILLPEKFYVHSDKMLKEYLENATHIQGAFDFNCQYIIKEAGNELTDTDKIPDGFSVSDLIPAELLIKALESAKIFHLLTGGFYVRRNKEIYELIKELFPCCLVEGENWSVYGDSEDYDHYGGQNALEFHKASHFQGKHFIEVTVGQLIPYLQNLKNSAVTIGELMAETSSSKVSSIATDLTSKTTIVNKSKKLFKF